MVWITLKNAVLGDWHQAVAGPFSLTWGQGESLVIAGPNGSGKSALAALWVGRLDAVRGEVEVSGAFRRADEAWIGFERQRLLLEWERHIDLTDVMESPDPGTLVDTFVGDPKALTRFGLEGKGTRGLKHLSTGELRRACLARAWVLGLPFLILDEPFEGLDVAGVALLRRLVDEARGAGVDVAFLTRQPDDVPGKGWRRLDLPAPSAVTTPPVPRPFVGEARGPGEPVIAFRQVTAGYPGVPVLQNFDWTVHRGDRWLVTGPNGSGKSTLLSLVSGDHPQVFGNDVTLLGRRRGPDLTLAEVRRRIVLVSYAAHLSFRNLFDVSGLDVLASGFQGTVGLRDEPTWDQVKASRDLAEAWGLGEAVLRPWEDLSWGTQRLILLGRALVAGPDILMLDEPCQGLDEASRRRFLDRVALWAEDRSRTLIYVTHRPDEVDPAAFLRLTLPV